VIKYDGVDNIDEKMDWYFSENERLESRVRELEAERDRLKEECVRWEAMYEGMMAERDGLEAELAKEKLECDKANKRSGERWKLLDAETQNHNITKKELSELRARHAALVEAASELHHWHDWGKNDEGMVVSSEVVRKIWAALA